MRYNPGAPTHGKRSFISTDMDASGRPAAASGLFMAVDLADDAITNQKFLDSKQAPNEGHFPINTIDQSLGAINDPLAPTPGEFSSALSNGLQVHSLGASENGRGTPETASTITVANASSFTTGKSVGANSVAEAASNTVAVIDAGGTLELAHAYSGTISFAGATGTLIIDHSSSFSGTISGQLAIGDVIDLADIAGGANVTIAYSGNNSPGTLTVSDGTHTANIALTGNYSLANFIASSDGHGGTSVVDPPLPAGVTLRPIDGGTSYYANNGFTYAANAGWDNPNFFSIGVWLDFLTSQSDANRWHDLSWNTAFALTANSDPSIARANGISVIQSATDGILPGNRCRDCRLVERR